MKRATYLGIDLGTSGLRAILVTAKGDTLAAAERPYTVSHPQHGWSEQNPAHWIAALDAIMADFATQYPKEMASVAAIGASGQMHGATLLNEAGTVLRPCILWNDTRSQTQAQQLDAMAKIRAISGNIVFPGFTAPKLVWVAQNEPQVFAQVAKVLLPKDYLNFWLTGLYTSEMSDAAGTAWLDVGARNWSQELLAASGMHANQMPNLVEGSETIGPIKPELADKWGLPRDAIVAGGAADNAAAACGVGTLEEGQGFVSLGTSGVLLAARDNFAPAPASAVHTFCHAVPNTWYQMGVILAASDSLNWLARNLEKSPADLTAKLGDTLSGPGHMRFLPYLSGERTPHNDASIRGAFLNIDIESDQTDMTRAVMEGVSFALRDCLEALQSTGAQFESLLAIGGGTGSTYWVELLATILNIPIDIPASGEFGAALGAARLAICAGSGAAPKDVMTRPKIARTIQPNAPLVAAYDAAYQKYKATYQAIKAVQ
jgi:xylulokinase